MLVVKINGHFVLDNFDVRKQLHGVVKLNLNFQLSE